MATNTSRLGLLKKDPVADGNDTFNIKTMLNDNWDKIDGKVATLGADGKVPADQLSISVSDASTTQKGVVMLEDSIASTSITKAATPKSVKTVSDALDAHKTDDTIHVKKDGTLQTGLNAQKINGKTASATPVTTEKNDIVGMVNELFTSVSNGKTQVANAITAKGQPASGNDTFAQLATAISNISTGLKTKLGIATTSSTAGSFQYAGNTGTVSKSYISVTGLEFEPKYVIIYSSTSLDFRLSIYIKDALDVIYSGPTVKLSSYDVDFVSSTNANLKGNAGTASVNSTSFVLPTDTGSLSQVNWIAFG